MNLFVIYIFWIRCYIHSVLFSERTRKFCQYLAYFKIFAISSWFPKLMHPLSSSVHVLQEKIIHQQKFIPNIIWCIHHVMFTSPTISRLRKRGLFVARSLDRLKVATRLAMCAQTNVGFLCCVSPATIATSLSRLGFVFDLKKLCYKNYVRNVTVT